MSPAHTHEYISLRDGRKLSYNISGPENGQLVLLSNSLLANYTAWDPFAEVLRAKGFRVLRYDQPGHGNSSVPADLESTTFLSISADVAELIKALNIGTIYAWIGDSMGAATGVIFTTQNPGLVKKLVLCDTIACSPSHAGVPDLFGPRVELARSDPKGIEILTEQTLERWFSSQWREANPAEVDRMRQLMRTTSPEGFITCCNALRHDSFDLRPYLKIVGSSVETAMLVVGELDANLPTAMAEMRDEIQTGFGTRADVGWAVIKRAGHLPMIDNSRQFIDEVLPFLEGKPANL